MTPPEGQPQDADLERAMPLTKKEVRPRQSPSKSFRLLTPWKLGAKTL